MTDYDDIPAIRWSVLKHMRDSPAAYRYALDCDRTDTDAFRFGRLFHTLTLEPHRFDAEYAVWSEGRRAGKAWAEFKGEAGDRTIITPEQLATADAMAAVVNDHPALHEYRDGAEYEVPLAWIDDATELRCKAKPDWLHAPSRTLIDLKSTTTTHDRRFGMLAARYGYHCQLAHYSRGMPWVPERVLLVAVEKTPPHDIAVFDVSEDDLYAGAEEVAELLRRVAYCERADQWPGRYPGVVPLQLPAWVWPEDDSETDLIVEA